MTTPTRSAQILIAIFLLTLPASAQDNVVPPVEVADAVAASEADMKPYSEPIEHTEVTLEMVPIPGGSFLMGSPESEADRNDDEGPQHEVKLAPFWMGKYEVTWDQYDVWGEGIDQLRRKIVESKQTPRDLAVDGVSKPTEPYTDMSFGMGRENYPAICMTQHAARTFCKWLSAKDRTLLPAADGGRVGICLPRGHHDRLFIRR